MTKTISALLAALVVCLGVASMPAHAQDIAPSADSVHSFIGVPVPADIPDTFTAQYVGSNHGNVFGGFTAGKAAAPGSFITAGVELSNGPAKATGGFHQCAWCSTSRGLYLMVAGDFGGSFGQNVGRAGDLQLSLAVRTGHGSERHVFVSAGVTAQDIDRFRAGPVTIASTKQLVTGATFRVGLITAQLKPAKLKR